MTSHHDSKGLSSGPLAKTFAALAKDSRKALAPFVTAGDPDLDTTLAVLEALDRAGAAVCELGVPYSDPIADGPVIQASYTRALAAGFTLEKFFEMVRKATSRVKMPILAMVSYSIIYRRGIDRFVDDAAAAGLAGRGQCGWPTTRRCTAAGYEADGSGWAPPERSTA